MSKVTEQLYIGSVKEASDKKWLQDNHITHIVNAAEELQNYFPGEFSYLNLRLQDIPRQSLYPVLEESYKFIWKAIGKGGTVLVHCHAGISRSSSIVIYFLMKLKGWVYMQALAYLKKRHERADPNNGFARQLVSVSPEAGKVFPGHTPAHVNPKPPPARPPLPVGPPRLNSKPTGSFNYASVASLGPGTNTQGMYSGF